MEVDDYFHGEADPVGVRRGVMRHRSRELESRKVLEASSPPGLPLNGSHASLSVLHSHVLLGLTIGGVASTVLTTAYSMFQVDVFLRVYLLPLQTFSWGSLVISLSNTANDLVGAWVIDYMATIRSRNDVLGVAGCIFALCFLFPFYKYHSSAGSPLDAAHFIVSNSLYDTLYSFVHILMGSVVNDNHHMTDQTRVRFMASGKAANLVTSFVVARIGLTVFDVDNLMQFRIFITCLALLAALLFILAQSLVSKPPKPNQGSVPVGRQGFSGWLFPQRHWHDDTDDDAFDSAGPPAKLRWRQVMLDFWTHKNFLAWIGMEMVLEAQYKFITNFHKTFVDGLVLKQDDTMAGMDRNQGDFFLSMIRPMTMAVGILVYIPIQKFTYRRVYRMLFLWNICLSVAALLLVDLDAAPDNSVYWILLYLFVYPVITGAVRSAGFHLAQADMVLEMKRNHASDGRLAEPSLAGLILGVNMCLCKPCESILPITAAQALQRYGLSKPTLFYLLVLPPIACSVLQLAAWRHYDLNPRRTAKMRDELRSYQTLGPKENGTSDHEQCPISPIPPYLG